MCGGNCQRSALSSGRMSQPSDWPAVQRPLPVTFHRTHNAEQGSVAAKIWGIECSFWERNTVEPLEKGHARCGHCPNVPQDGDLADRDEGDNDGQE